MSPDMGEPGRVSPSPVGWCPRCGSRIDDRSFLAEYWIDRNRVFHCWCRSCDFICDVTPVERVIAHDTA